MEEAIDLKDNGGGFAINNSDEFSYEFEKLLLDENKYNKSSVAARKYVDDNAGATQIIVDKIKEYLS